jgi:hypothetical protein
VQVTAVKRWTAQHQTVFNLTVDGVHTYYVVAAGTPILTHNCNQTPVDLFVGGAGTRIKPAWRTPQEYDLDVAGNVVPDATKGFSTFADPAEALANVNAKYHWKLPAGTRLPSSLGVVHDGPSLEPHELSHHTFFPTTATAPDQLLEDFAGLPWAKGKIGPDGVWQAVD